MEKKEENKAFDFGATEVGTGTTVAPTATAPVVTAKPTTAQVPAPAAKSNTSTPAVTVTESTETPAAPKVKGKRGRPKKNPNQTITNADGTVQPPPPPLTPVQKFRADIAKKAGLTSEQMPTINQLFEGRSSQPTIAIRDIACFVGSDQDTELMTDLAKSWSARNTIHPAAEIDAKQVAKVGTEILGDGRMYATLEIARIKDAHDRLECVSGRHRLAFLALAFGLDAKVSVLITDYTEQEAKRAAIRANESRKQKTLEKAEHNVASAVQGNLDVEREELYRKSVQKRSQVADFCVVSIVFKGLHGAKLKFPITDLDPAKGVVTLGSLRNFWKKALGGAWWESTITRGDFDVALKDSVNFLNELYETMSTMRGFDASQHLATQTLVAIGGVYAQMVEADGKPPLEAVKVKKIAKGIVDMGDIARAKSEVTRKALWKAIRG